MNPIQDQDLTPAQVTQLTKAMLSVAMVDGIHPAEAALIGQFYESSRSADMPTTAESQMPRYSARALPGCALIESTPPSQEPTPDRRSRACRGRSLSWVSARRRAHRRHECADAATVPRRRSGDGARRR